MSNWSNISADDLLAKYKEWNIVDIRDGNSFQQGHIPGATHLTNNTVNQFIEEQDFSTPLVVVCYVGNSSRGAAEVLSNAGFETVFSLDGGMSYWQNAHPNELEFSES